MAQYVKRPIPVEAVLFVKGMEDGVGDPLGDNGNMPYISTLENKKHFGNFEENYLVKGNHQDKWLVRKDIFEATYEPVVGVDATVHQMD